MITKISIEVSLGIFFPNTNVELMIRLDESEMKNIKIVGLDTMVLIVIIIKRFFNLEHLSQPRESPSPFWLLIVEFR